VECKTYQITMDDLNTFQHTLDLAKKKPGTWASWSAIPVSPGTAGKRPNKPG
jgi:hypothetical protein